MEQNKETVQDLAALLQEGRTVVFPPTGTSMWPLIRTGDFLEATGLQNLKRDPKRGDVCIYRRPTGILVVHRMIRREKEACFFAGDHQCETEGPLPADCIVGRMTALIRNEKRIPVNRPDVWLSARVWLVLRPLRWKIIRFGSKVKRIFGKNTKK